MKTRYFQIPFSGDRHHGFPHHLITLLLTLICLFPARAEQNLARQLTEQQREIQTLKEKMKRLEQMVTKQAEIIRRLQGRTAEPVAQKEAVLPPEVEPQSEAGIWEGLQFSGFFDVHGYTRGSHQPKLTFGTFELDLEYHHPSHFAMNAALVWDGDNVTVGTGVVDYHWFHDPTPPPGKNFLPKGIAHSGWPLRYSLWK